MMDTTLHRGLLGRLVGAVGDRLGAGRRGATAGGETAFDFALDAIDFRPMALADWRGHALLVVNTASKCGFTGQYAGLQRLHETYKDRGFTVIGVPSNDFGGQEPGSEAEIQEFCRSHFKIGFPMAAKTRVAGRDAHPFYRWALRELGRTARPRWNFHKYLVAPDGRLAGWFSTVTGPTSPRVIRAIERVLPG